MSIYKIDSMIPDYNEYVYYGYKKHYDYLDGLLNPCIKDGESNYRLVYAKAVSGINGTQYYIRANSRNEIFDPESPIANKDRNFTQFNRTSNTYIEVHQKVFVFYLNYLRTLNRSWFNQAYREI